MELHPCKVAAAAALIDFMLLLYPASIPIFPMDSLPISLAVESKLVEAGCQDPHIL